jgi:hypothetical protein
MRSVHPPPAVLAPPVESRCLRSRRSEALARCRPGSLLVDLRATRTSTRRTLRRSLAWRKKGIAPELGRRALVRFPCTDAHRRLGGLVPLRILPLSIPTSRSARPISAWRSVHPTMRSVHPPAAVLAPSVESRCFRSRRSEALARCRPGSLLVDLRGTRTSTRRTLRRSLAWRRKGIAPELGRRALVRFPCTDAHRRFGGLVPLRILPLSIPTSREVLARYPTGAAFTRRCEVFIRPRPFLLRP